MVGQAGEAMTSGYLGQLGCGLLLMAAVLSLPGIGRLHRAWRAGVALLVWMPWPQLSLAHVLFGLIGTPSVLMTALSMVIVIERIRGQRLIRDHERQALSMLSVAAAVYLYPFSLGLTGHDPYALGYGSYVFTVSLFVVTTALWYRRHYWLVVGILLAIASYLTRILESDNLWDYLIDPILVGYACSRLLQFAYRDLLSRRNKTVDL
jgi:hypothetical protein